MKHSRLIITALLALTGLCASAADLTEQYHATFDTSQYPSGRLLAQDSGYMPLVVEGRRWDYEDNGKEFSYIIRGDTVIGGKSYKKVYQVWDDGNDSHYFASLRESDRRVYAVRDSQTQEEMLYDFALSLKLDEIEYDETHIYRTLTTTGTRCTDGNLHRNTLFSIFNTASIYETSTAYLWVEGVGAPFYQLFSPTGFRTGDEVCVFLACYQEDNCIYEYNDMFISPEIVGWPLPCKPLLRQGRRWNYRYCAADVSQQVDVRQWLEGDTTVAGNKYMKLYEVRGDEGAHVRGLLREDSCYIYWYDQEANTERLVMKQGMGKNEQMELCIPAAAQENCRMVLARNIGSADYTYRRQGFETPSGDTILWIEGIGYEDCGLSFGPDHGCYELLSVCDGDECIYGTEIVVPPLPDEIVAPKVSRTASSVLYDLQGRRVQGTPQRGLYIRDGKKVLK